MAAHGKAGRDSRHAGQARQYVPMESAIVIDARDLHPKNIVSVTRHQIPFLDLGMAAQRGFEADEIFFRLPLKLDLNNRHHSFFRRRASNDRGVAANHTCLFEDPNAAKAGGRGQANFSGQSAVGNPPIKAELCQYPAVGLIESLQQISPFFCTIYELIPFFECL